MVNKVTLLGRLGSDPETRQTNGGKSVCILSVATTEKWKDAQRKDHERTEWHRVVLYGKVAEVAGKFLEKGQLVYLEGKLSHRSYERDGQKKYVTEVIADTMKMLPRSSPRNESRSGDDQGDDNYSFQDFGPEPSFSGSDDIPF
nr:single-stranded DNA-binding protein [Bdellovibrio sp. HM001]